MDMTPAERALIEWHDIAVALVEWAGRDEINPEALCATFIVYAEKTVSAWQRIKISEGHHELRDDVPYQAVYAGLRALESAVQRKTEFAADMPAIRIAHGFLNTEYFRENMTTLATRLHGRVGEMLHGHKPANVVDILTLLDANRKTQTVAQQMLQF